MRYYTFIVLVAIALILDILLGINLTKPQTHVQPDEPARAQVTLRRVMQAQPTARSNGPGRAVRPTATVLSTLLVSPTAPPPLPTASATVTPEPKLIASHTVAFTPGSPEVKANINLALNHYYGALQHVVLPPGGVFSFNSTLGVHPQRLPWKNVRISLPEASEELTPTTQIVQGGGLCDLASRYVMAARPLLPNHAFRFVNHVISNGVHLSGVPTRDSVTIWAIGGGQGERDLIIKNVTELWLEFVVERENQQITVHANLWDSIPPTW